MKRYALVLYSLLLILPGFGQLLQPVTWEMSSTQTGVNEYTLIFKASIQEGWKLYSHDLPENGPIPTSLIFEKLPTGVQLVGEMEELGRMEEQVEPLFNDMLIKFYHKRLTLRQKVKISGNATLSGYIDYMSCDDKQCIALSQDFTFDLQGVSGNLVTDPNADYSKVKDPVQWNITSEKINDNAYWINFSAAISPTWKLYSQASPEGGAQPMRFYFDNAGQGYQLVGKVEEIGHLEVKPEPLFENKVLRYYHDKVTMRQQIKLDSANAVIKGYVDYQTCDAMQCLFKQKDFSLQLTAEGIVVQETAVPADAGVARFGDFKVDTAFARNALCDSEISAQVTDARGRN